MTKWKAGSYRINNMMHTGVFDEDNNLICYVPGNEPEAWELAKRIARTPTVEQIVDYVEYLEHWR